MNNTANTTVKIKLNVQGGVLSGNILEAPVITQPPPVITCVENGLDFSCPENTQYIAGL